MRQTPARQLLDGWETFRGQPMPLTEHDEELLAKQREIVEAIVDLIGPAIDCGFQPAVEQARLQVGGAGIHDLKLDAGMLRLQVG